MISALILSSRHFIISVLGVVVRGVKKHYVNIKTEQTLSTLLVPSLGRTAQDLTSSFVSYFVIPYTLNI